MPLRSAVELGPLRTSSSSALPTIFEMKDIRPRHGAIRRLCVDCVHVQSRTVRVMLHLSEVRSTMMCCTAGCHIRGKTTWDNKMTTTKQTASPFRPTYHNVFYEEAILRMRQDPVQLIRFAVVGATIRAGCLVNGYSHISSLTGSIASPSSLTLLRL
jgi:hypothetical protein